jgi:hypothetical protein
MGRVRHLKVDPAFVDLMQIEFRNTSRGITLLIQDEDQGGVEFAFPFETTAERFGDRLTAAFARRFAPEPPSLWQKLLA